MKRPLRASVPTLFFLLLSAPAFAQKTDVIVLSNGDKLTGEIKAQVHSDLSFRVSGRVIERNVEVGTRVTPDEPLLLDLQHLVGEENVSSLGSRSPSAAGNRPVLPEPARTAGAA